MKTRYYQQRGTLSATCGSGWWEKYIQFSPRFLSTPIVCVYQENGQYATDLLLPILNAHSEYGFSIGYYNLNRSINIEWYAFGCRF